MKHTYLILSIFTFVSCSQNNAKQSDPAFKVKDTERIPLFLDTQIVEDFEAKEIDLEANNPLKLSPLNIRNDIGQIAFLQNNKTVFMYDAKTKKGQIVLNGITYSLKMQNMNNGYKLHADNVTISALNGKFEDMVSDCAYGKFADVTITQGTLKLQLHNVHVQDCAGMLE